MQIIKNWYDDQEWKVLISYIIHRSKFPSMSGTSHDAILSDLKKLFESKSLKIESLEEVALRTQKVREDV